jgi:transcriptional regulator of acetoin/glycerol metabolism
MAPTVLEHGRVLESRERLQQVLQIAGNEMNSLHQQLSGAGHAVLLTDARGVILNCVTAPAERKISSVPGCGSAPTGASLRRHQRHRHLPGRAPGADHPPGRALSRPHTGLTCSASPVFDPHGELLAVLDVSSARHDVSRQSQFHTMALVNLSAKMIESCYFLRYFDNQWLLRFHLQAESVGLFSEGLLAFDGEGRICAVNQSALNLLGHIRGGLLGKPVEAFFDCSLDELLGRASANASASWPLRTRDGRHLFALLRGESRKPAKIMPAPVVAKAQPLAGICLGDAALQADFRKALRVFERDVPLLINGETGSGKEAFAKAVHQASQRANKAFVALNCAAIPRA